MHSGRMQFDPWQSAGESDRVETQPPVAKNARMDRCCGHLDGSEEIGFWSVETSSRLLALLGEPLGFKFVISAVLIRFVRSASAMAAMAKRRLCAGSSRLVVFSERETLEQFMSVKRSNSL